MWVAADGYFGVCDRDRAGDRAGDHDLVNLLFVIPWEDIVVTLLGLLGGSDSEEDIVGVQ